MDAFSHSRLEDAIIRLLAEAPNKWVKPHSIAEALAGQGFGPLEPLGRHVVPMLELLYAMGRVERMSAVGPRRSSAGYWRLAIPTEDAA